jgi:hypothetical protein
LLPKLFAATRSIAKRRREREDALRLLHVDYLQQYDFVIPHTHPLLELSGPHPDDLAAFRAIADPALAYCAENNLLEIVEAMDTQLERNLVLIGSPEAEPLTRLAFGYKRIKDEPGFEYAGNTIDLPFRWHEDPRDIHGTCRRWVAGHGWTTRPNWPLISGSAMAESRLIPKVDNEGVLATDWLLVTVTPNFFTRKALDEGKVIISVAGTHGTGTRAFKLLLRDARAIKQIAEVVDHKTRAFQVVAEASDISHGATGTEARRIQVHHVVELPDREEVWNTARVSVASRFSDWTTEEVARNIPYPHERR